MKEELEDALQMTASTVCVTESAVASGIGAGGSAGCGLSESERHTLSPPTPHPTHIPCPARRLWSPYSVPVSTPVLIAAPHTAQGCNR